MEQFTNLYPISKTLRFELIPDPRTKDFLEHSDLIAQDEHRAESYKKVKKIIDRYHKAYIESVLGNLKLPCESRGGSDSLEELYELYSKGQKSDADRKALEKVQDKLRKLIADALTKDNRYKRIDKKELIREDIMSVIQPDEQTLIDEFRDFTTYFTGFHENRKNMYTAEAQSTAIAYRLIHENLPKFIDNMGTFNKIAASPIAEKLSILYEEMSEYLNVKDIREMFELGYYTDLLTQSQIEVYNAVIGGRTTDDGKKIQGLNEYVNLYNQQQGTQEARLPKLKPLFKQILSDREAVSWLPEEFSTDSSLLQAIKEFYRALSDHVLLPLKELMVNLPDYNLYGIFIPNDVSLTDISKSMFGDWSVIKNAVVKDVKHNCPPKKNETSEAYDERIHKLLKRENSFSIGYLNDCIKDAGKDICSHFASLGESDDGISQNINLIAQINNAYNEVQPLIEKEYPESHNLSQEKDNVTKIKALLDAIKSLQRFVRPLLGNGDEPEKDERFYGELSVLSEELDHITALYNKVRNRMTRKTYSIEKFKLNFENSTLLDGWDLNKERDNTCVILRKNGLYYLAIMRKQFNRIFLDAPSDDGGDAFEKMEYKLLPGANKMLPKVFFSKSRINEFAPSDELLRHYKAGTHKKGENFSLKDCHELIDFFKSSIQKHEDWNKFDYHFSPTETYEDLSGFYREVEQMGYKISFKKIPFRYIDLMVEDGKLFLFQIYNKDFSIHSKGTPNLHTLYWKMVFDERNLANVVYKLNGQAEVFYRKRSLSYDKPTHPAHQAIKNKNPEGTKPESTFAYDLIKDKRYTMDKFQFHVPITINFKATGSGSINPLVDQYIHDHHDLHFIGIDRGARHLLYVTVIDSTGHIKEQFSLNEIANEYNGHTYKTDYRSLLNRRETKRQQERQSWSTIESIKDLKQGYLSQVIHKITTLMMKYNAIVVLEDLNMGFKRRRQCVESSVYQQFEKALIDKLNLLVDKKIDAECPGGLLHPYQLTNRFTSFRDMRRQNGFLFYIPAWNTSKIDPVTGFVDLLHPRYESIEKARAFISKFKSIRYNEDKGWFELAFDYNDFTTMAEGSRTQWTLCSHGSRVETFRNNEKNSMWDSREIDLTKAYSDLFAKYGINLAHNLKEAIAGQNEKDFFERLIHLVGLTLQMRNSITGTDIDYMISPVADEAGNFYDSRKCSDDLPKNADANGAYNIARKGLWVARQIQSTPIGASVNLSLTNREWLHFAQTKPYLDD